MSDASQRTAQQQRIQQLHERFELYNSQEASSFLSTGPTLPGVGGLPTQAGSAGKAAAAKPSRVAPVLSSPATGSAEATRPTSVPPPQPQAQAQPLATAPAPAPQLARSLAQEFSGTTSSPPRTAAATAGASPSPILGAATARPRPATATPPAPAAPQGDGAAPAAPAPAAARRASDVFDYYHDSGSENSGGSEYVEYEVEEVEEEYTNSSDAVTDDEEGEEAQAAAYAAHTQHHHHTRHHQRQQQQQRSDEESTLHDMLQRLYRAYSGSPDRLGGAGPHQPLRASSTGGVPSRAASAPSPPPRDASPPPAVAGTTAAAAAAETAASATTHPFLQQAAALYRQRLAHRLQQQQQQQQHSPFNTGHAWSTSEGATSPTTTEPIADSDYEGTTTTTGSGSSSPSPELAGGAPMDRPDTSSPLPSFEALAAAAAVQGGMEGGSADALSSSPSPSSSPALCFDQLETAYRRLLLLQRGVQHVAQRAGPACFPPALPHQGEAEALAEQRDMLFKREAEMRAAPPEGPSLDDVRQREGAAVEATLADLHKKFELALKSLQVVADRESLVEGKRALLRQRETDLAKQREARVIVEREVAAAEARLKERADQLQQREADYSTRLQQHDQQQKAAQEQIGEVEQLSKRVSSWLAILEERDRRLARKERRLQHAQADLQKRTEDVQVWKKATQRVKQLRPPSPPQIS